MNMEPSDKRFVVLEDRVGYKSKAEKELILLSLILNWSLKQKMDEIIANEIEKEIDPKIADVVAIGNNNRAVADADYGDVEKWKLACFVDMKRKVQLYLVVFHAVDSTKPIALINTGKERHLIDIGYTTLSLNAGDFQTLMGAAKDCFDDGLKRQGIRTPWKRIKRCWLCDAKKSKTVFLRVCKGCRVARYCSRHCQKAAWNTDHRLQCFEIAFRRQFC